MTLAYFESEKLSLIAFIVCNSLILLKCRLGSTERFLVLQILLTCDLPVSVVLSIYIFHNNSLPNLSL